MFRLKNFIPVLLWLCVAGISVALISQPLGNSVQIVLSFSIIGVLAIIMILKLDGIWRHVFLALGTVVVLRYAYWRTTSTLPPMEDIYSFVPGVILYAAEMYCIAMLAISLFVVADPREREAAPRLSEEDAPSVDVFVPSYNEGPEILALTLSAAKAMRYPADKLKVFLLDDGGTDQKRNSTDQLVADAARHRAERLKSLCAELGVTYMTREENVHAKAGNLNSGLIRTNGDLVVVFDADHAPEKDFLLETVGYFSQDPKLFLVQTPHFFSNPDPIERNLNTFSKMPSENEMFYGRVQKGLDRWNASFFCGSAAVLRREALAEVGGFSGITITEDCETALELHSRGWNSVYVDKPMIVGLQPETVSSFIGQRSRWCRGMIQILLLRNPLLKAGLTIPQRICYLSSALFWFFPIARPVFFFAPLLFILFNMKVFVASTDDFLAHTVTYLVVGEMIRTYLYGSVRWPWMSELYEYVQSVYLFRAIFSVIINPRKPTFNVTAKGVTSSGDHLSELALPYAAIFLVLLATLGFAVYRYTSEPEINGLLLIVGAWNLLNLLVAGAALGVVTERHSEVSGVEIPVQVPVKLTFGETTVLATATRVSAAGATLLLNGRLSQPLRRNEYGRLSLVEATPSLIVNSLPLAIASIDDTKLVVKFDAEDLHYPLIAELTLQSMEEVRSQRRLRQRKQGLLAASFAFLAWGLRYPMAALGIAVAGGASSTTKQRLPAAPANTNAAALTTPPAKTQGAVQ